MPCTTNPRHAEAGALNASSSCVGIVGDQLWHGLTAFALPGTFGDRNERKGCSAYIFPIRDFGSGFGIVAHFLELTIPRL